MKKEGSERRRNSGEKSKEGKGIIWCERDGEERKKRSVGAGE